MATFPRWRVQYNHKILWLSLAISVSFFASADTSDKLTKIHQEDFEHLVNLLGDSRRFHIVSELTRNGHQLQIEEFLDLNSWTQLIQFKWLRDIRITDQKYTYTTKKTSFLIINNGAKEHIIEYKPYVCKIIEYEPTPMGWLMDLDASLSIPVDDTNVDSDFRHDQTIISIISKAHNSPYLAKVTNELSNPSIYGVSGLWLKARYPGPKNGVPTRLSNEDGTKGNWIQKLEDIDLTVNYYFDDQLLMNNGSSGRIARNPLNLIELRYSNTSKLIDMINVVNIDLEYSDQLSRDLFKLPIGFNCPSNPVLEVERQYLFSSDMVSKVLELELVGTKYNYRRDGSVSPVTDIKTASFAQTRHPMNSESSLMMLYQREDRRKIIHDYHNRISYNIKYDLSKHYCDIERLHLKDEEKEIADYPIDIKFDMGVVMSLDYYLVNYILSVDQDKSDWRLINEIDINDETKEIIFESELPKDNRQPLKQISEDISNVTVVRVFQQSLLSDRLSGGSKYRRKSNLKLARVILIALDLDRKRKLFKGRINLLSETPIRNYQSRAKLFDVRQCFSMDSETIELEAYYPLDSMNDDTPVKDEYQIIEAFYGSSANWVRQFQVSSEDIRRRVGASINFLRVPSVEITDVSNGYFKLKLLVVDKLSPIYTFDMITSSSFIDFTGSESFMAYSAKECARICDKFNCPMFAFDLEVLECKISHLPYNAEDANLKVIKKMSSQVYHSKSIKQTSQTDEANLIDIHSLIESEKWVLPVTDEKADPEIIEKKYQLFELPFLSFSYIDRHSRSSEFAPPKELILVPDQVHITHIPHHLDVSEESIKSKAMAAFKSTIKGMHYAIDKLDKEGNKYERTFIERANSKYYTLRRLPYVDLDSCAILCYNIEESDSDSGGEQVCESFSYCSYLKECVLLIGTDMNYTVNILDLVSQGDVVLDIDTKDTLMEFNYRGVVAQRNHLADYEGPIMVANRKSDAIDDPLEAFYERETVWKETGSDKVGSSEDIYGDKCSTECHNRNKRGGFCLGFEFCYQDSYRDVQTSPVEYSCQLLIMKEPRKDDAVFRQKVRLLRNKLMRQKLNESQSNNQIGKLNCHRYVHSHLLEYTHIKRRRVSDKLLSKLTPFESSEETSSLDSCSNECSQLSSECLAFQYCIGIEMVTRSVVRNCTFFGQKSNLISKTKNQDLPGESFVEYSKNCHIYIKSGFDLLEKVNENNKSHMVLIVFLSISIFFLLTSIYISKRRGIRLFGALNLF